MWLRSVRSKARGRRFVHRGAVLGTVLAALLALLGSVALGAEPAVKQAVTHVVSLVHRAAATPATQHVSPAPGTAAAQPTPPAPAAQPVAAPAPAPQAAPVPPPLGAPGPTDWPSFGGGLGNGFAAAQSPVSAANAAGLTLAWQVPADNEVSSNPVAVGNQIFFGTYAGTVYSVARDAGTVFWTRKLDGSPINGGLLYDGGRLFVPTSGGQVYALDPQTGQVVWASGSLLGGLKDALRASPQAYGGVVYESLGGTNDDVNEQGGVVALDERTGKVLWRTMLVQYSGGGAAVFSPPAVIPSLGELVVGTGNPTPYPGNTGGNGAVPAGPDPDSDSLVALSLRDGHVMWASQTHPHDASDADFIAAPNVVQLPGGRLAVGDGEKDGAYHLFDAASGQPIWDASLAIPQTETLVVATAAVSGGRIFVGTMDVAAADAAHNWPGSYQAPGKGRLVALDAASGTVVWSDALPSTIAAAPVVSNGVVLAIEADGTLIAADAGSGRTLWQTQTAGKIWNAEAALTLAGRTLLVPLAGPGGVAAYALPAGVS